MPLLAHSALAQSGTTVTEADIARAQRSQPIITERDIDNARRKYGVPFEAAPQGGPPSASPNIGALPQPNATNIPDLGLIAKGFEVTGNAAALTQGLPSAPALLVFVSFAMPQATLERLLDQAARAKATLVLRGLIDGSLRETVLRVQRLIGQRKVGLQVDPQAFDRFHVDKTPSFVLVREGASAQPCAAGQCLASDAYAMVAGDVSLDYALEYVQRSAPRFAKNAAGFLGKLRSVR
ncbi:MAG: type-F conjugative transfer system pilin assembly protein TrbC [Pseudomonadota bacterium]